MMRVKVWKFRSLNGVKTGYLGEGELLGPVPMAEVYTEEEYRERDKGFIRDACRRLGLPYKGAVFEERYQRMWEEFRNIPYDRLSTPKIRLDSGEIVYGCQVEWWEEAEVSEEKSEKKRFGLIFPQRTLPDDEIAESLRDPEMQKALREVFPENDESGEEMSENNPIFVLGCGPKEEAVRKVLIDPRMRGILEEIAKKKKGKRKR